MARALALAERGAVHDDAQSARRLRDRRRMAPSSAKAGTSVPARPHAEVNALADAQARGRDPRGATRLRDAGALQSHGAHAAVHRGAASPPASRVSSPRCATRIPLRRAARSGCARAGVAVDIGPVRGTKRASSTSASCRVHDARPAVGADEGSGEPRRPHGACRRREPMDHRRSGACRRPSLARARLRGPDRHRHRAVTTIRR